MGFYQVSPEEELRNVTVIEGARQRAQAAVDSAWGPNEAARANTIARAAPWMSPGLVLSLAKGRASMQTISAAAMVDAARRARINPTNRRPGEVVNAAALNPGDRRLFGREREQAYFEAMADPMTPGNLIGREREAIGEAVAPELRQAQRLGVLDGEGVLHVPEGKRTYDREAGQWVYENDDARDKWQAFEAAVGVVAKEPDYEQFIPVMKGDKPGLYSVETKIITDILDQEAAREAKGGIASLVLDALPQGIASGLDETIGNRRFPDPFGTQDMGMTQSAGIQTPKDAVRAGFMAIEMPIQESMGLIRASWGASQGGPGLSGWQPQSDFLVALSDGGMDPGDGWMVDPDSAVVRERKRRERNTRATINGEVLTIGRAAAGGLSHINVIEPGSTEYRWVSGLVDAAVAIYGDPTAWGAGRLATADDLRHTFRGGDDLADEVGLIRGAFSRNIDRPTVNGWLSGPKGTTVRQNIAAETNGGQLWRDLGRRLTPAEIRQLRETSTADEVTDVLGQHLGTTYRRTDEVWNEPHRWVKPIVESRWLTDMPAPYLNLSDEASILPQTERYLRNVRAPEEVTLGFLDEMVTAGGDKVATLDVVERMVDYSFGQVGFRNAMTRRRMVRNWRNEVEAARAELVDQVTGDSLMNEITLGDDVLPVGNPFDQLAHADQIIGLPDPRQLRRVASRYNRLIASGVDETEMNRLGSGLLWWQDQVWKPFTLLRGAWSVRVIPEEQLRMAASDRASFFKDPASYVVWAMSRKTDLLGKPLMETNKFREAASRGSAGFLGEQGTLVGAGRRVRVDKGDSRFMEVAAQNLVELHNDPVANVVANAPTLDAAERILRGTTTTTGAASTAKLRALASRFGIAGRSSMSRDDLVKALQGVDPTNLPAKELRNLAASLGVAGRTSMTLDELRFAVRDEWSQLGARNVPGSGAEAYNAWKAANPTLAADPGGLRAYLEMTARHIKFKTGDNDELLDAVRTGTLRGKPIVEEGGARISGHLSRQLEDFYDVLPEAAVGEKLIQYGARRKGFVEWAFAQLMGRPTTYLSRHPLFKQEYWARVEEMVSQADPSVHDELVDNARKYLQTGPFGKKAVDRMAATPSVGKLTLEDIDEFAKAHALDKVKDLLYDLEKKSQIADTMRLVSPFGEAWREVVTRWATLLNPTTPRGVRNLRRFQQGLGAARGPDFGEAMGVDEQWDPETEEWYQPGFFWRDEFGEEVFIYPGSQWLMNRGVRLPDWLPLVGGKGAPGIPVPLTGRVQGLNMVGSIFPGLGPVASVPVSWFLPDKPGLQRTLREYMLPFGAVTEQGSAAILDMVNFMPPWMRTGLVATLGGGYDYNSDRIWANSTMATANYLYSTGRYDTSTDAGQQQLMHDAKEAAGNVYLIRSLVAFGAPAPPSPEFMVESNEGLIRLAVLRDDYYTMLQDDPVTADERFLERWGDITAQPGQDMVGMTMQAFTREVQGGVIPTQEFDDWANANGDLAQDYSAIWAFFGPQGGEFDYDVYQRQILTGERQQLSLDQWMRFGQNHLGMMQKNRLDEMMSDNPTREQQEWYDRGVNWIYQNYPGFGDPTGRVDDADFEIVRRQIDEAVKDPRLTSTPTGEALAQYWEARNAVLDVAGEMGLRGGSTRNIGTADSLAEHRAWLYRGGSELARQDEGFKAIWNRHLRPEVEPDEEER